ncbi:MAG: ribonuclease H-like domain-containing protein [Synergistaceae bacterium]|jgi:uncharacterized protein YprB with RNaseH-like and TPR domain|nr:ribonuclease H-like domain-containing protein [Synergistaceae bacterium]
MGKFDRFLDDIEEYRRTTPPGGGIQAGGGLVRGLPEGSWVRDGVYMMEFRHRIGELYGTAPLDSPDEMEVMRHFGATGGTVFLDLETTGLSGGTGTYSFLCGIGRVFGDEFRVMEFFLEGPAREASFLEAIGEAIPPGSCLVTYNGMTFDIPMLRKRHVLARSAPAWDNMPHIDLLHHARRLYRGYLESCSLGCVERHVLGVRRGGADIPGSMIPALYAQYLRSGDAAPLGGVFYHNELDIVSLAALYCRVARALEGRSEDGRELLRAGEIWRSKGHGERAAALWNMACQNAASEVEARLRRARASKSDADFRGAREDLMAVLGRVETGMGKLPAGMTMFMLREELAKLEEHRFRSPDAALEHTKAALLWVRANRYLLGRAGLGMYGSMMRRYERLMKKISRIGDGVF